VPRGFSCFSIVAWCLARCDFAPAADTIHNGFHKKNPAILDDPKTCFKRRLETHVNFTQCDRFNLHKAPECSIRYFNQFNPDSSAPGPPAGSSCLKFDGLFPMSFRLAE